MKQHLIPFIAASVLALGCSKDTAPTTTPADATAATPTETADDSGEASGEDPGEPADSDEGTDEPGDEITADDLPQDAGPITDEYGAVALVEDPRAVVENAEKWANVKLEIRSPGGKVFKDPGKVFRYGEKTRIDFDFEGITHTFLLDIGKPGSTAPVNMSYMAGGEEVVRNYDFEAKLSKREVLRLDDGTAVALTISTKTIKPLPVEEREKLKGAAGERDPLAGAEKKK